MRSKVEIEKAVKELKRFEKTRMSMPEAIAYMYSIQTLEWVLEKQDELTILTLLKGKQAKA